MSATPAPDVERTVERCQPADVTPVRIDADDLASTAPGYLRDLKRELAVEGFAPVEVTVDACFDQDCSLATQDETDAVREYVRAASFLGASTFTVRCDVVDNEEKVRPAVEACAERAHREGLTFEFDGPFAL